MNVNSTKSVLAGTMITAGSAIGAGMFSLPVVSSGMWFVLSLFILVAIWYLNYLSSLVLLEINLQFHVGSSFDTFVHKILGGTWNFVNGLGIAFLLYILLYAYFSAFGNIVSHSAGLNLDENSFWSNGMLSLLVGGILATIVWKSTAVVGKISTVLVFGLVIAFVISMSGLTLQVDFNKLFNIGSGDHDYFSYTWAALPYFLTSFGISSIVPSLYKYYGKEPDKIRKSLLYGSLIALSVFTLFIYVSFGIISREEFIDINAAGGNMGHLVSALTTNSKGQTINFAINVFSNFAIISSFLGVGLSLFDYISDKFKFEDNARGRFYSACITFLPSGMASFFFPNGFIAAIGFSGLVMVFSFFLVPILMIWKTRKSHVKLEYKLWGGKALLILILIASLTIVVCHVLAMMNYLPKY